MELKEQGAGFLWDLSELSCVLSFTNKLNCKKSSRRLIVGFTSKERGLFELAPPLLATQLILLHFAVGVQD